EVQAQPGERRDAIDGGHLGRTAEGGPGGADQRQVQGAGVGRVVVAEEVLGGDGQRERAAGGDRGGGRRGQRGMGRQAGGDVDGVRRHRLEDGAGDLERVAGGGGIQDQVVEGGVAGAGGGQQRAAEESAAGGQRRGQRHREDAAEGRVEVAEGVQRH